MQIGLWGRQGFGNSKTNEAAKWGETPQIQKKASVTAQNAMTDSFVEQIKSLAKEDAQKGIYMDKRYIQLQQSQMKQYVSPDRSGPMAQATKVIQEVAKEDDPLLELLNSLLRRLSGKAQRSNGEIYVSLSKMSGNCSGTIHSNPGGQSAEIYAPNGENIASYNSTGGGWTVIQTKEELKFQGEADGVYAQAFREARAAMAGAAQQTAVPASGNGMTGGFDVKV